MENKKFEELNEQELTNVSGGGIVLGKEDLTHTGRVHEYIASEQTADVNKGFIGGFFPSDTSAKAVGLKKARRLSGVDARTIEFRRVAKHMTVFGEENN